jgi:hypothetical protein
MVALALDRAPPPASPLRFLRWVPAWGMVAAALIAWQGPLAFASRWAPGTVALVHAVTLGVLGNAMLGALLQFLPVVAGIRPRPAGAWLPALFNAGVLGLVCGLLHAPALLPWAAMTVAGAIVLTAGSALVGWRFERRQAWLRLGLGLVLVALVATAGLGAALALAVAGWWVVALPVLVDIHAAVAIVGVVLLLCGTVGSVVLPMFQGTPMPPTRALAGWIVVVVLAVVLAVGARVMGHDTAMARLLAVPAAAFALAVLALQWRAPQRRNPALVGFWRWGASALLAAATFAAVGSDDPQRPILVGLLGLGVALPALVLGMWLEIVAFLAWLDLQRRRPRGRRVPGVDALLPESHKAVLLWLHRLAGILLVIAACRPVAYVVATAAFALFVAYAATGIAWLSLRRRCRGVVLAPVHAA